MCLGRQTFGWRKRILQVTDKRPLESRVCPQKKTLWNLCKRVKNHSEQRIDSKLIPNCSVIIEVSGLCLPGLKAAAEMDRTFPPLFPSSGSADLHSHGHGDPSSSQGAVSSQSEWHRVLGESKHPTVRSDQSSATGDGQPGALERLPSVNGQQPEKDRARQDRGSAPGYKGTLLPAPK